MTAEKGAIVGRRLLLGFSTALTNGRNGVGFSRWDRPSRLDICPQKPHILCMRVLESFILPGRGLIVSTDEVIELPGTHRVANVKSPDGTQFQAEIVRSNSHNPDYLLVGVGKDDVPVGSMIDVS